MQDKDEEAARLAALLAGHNRAEFARKHGVPGGAAMIYQHIKGIRPINLEAANAYARGLGVSLHEISPRLAAQVQALQGARAAAAVTIEDEDERFVPVQTGTLRVSAGVDGFTLDEENEQGQPIFFRQDWLQSRGYKAANLYALKVRGRSMEPTLYADDLVVINIAEKQPLDGEVFIVNAAGEVVVKRLMYRAGNWYMHSDSIDQTRYPPVMMDERCFIIGRVIYRQSERI